MTFNRILIVLLVAVGIFGIAMFGQLVQTVDADEIVVIQSPVSGNLAWYTTPGMKWQGLGKVTTYHKRSIYSFETKMRFNDGAHGTLTGSIQYELPTDDHSLTAIHVRFGSQESVQEQLVETVVNKAIYMTGPLMSSKESYAERRNELISRVEDQVAHGVYRTKQRDERIDDPITGEKRTITVVEIVTEGGVPLRQEDAVLAEFGVKPFNFAIDALDYDERVEQQIAAQQQATMDVATAIAESRKAEQRKLTVEAEGAAKAAETKWQQEAIKAREVTAAEQRKEVATLEAQQRRDVATLDAEAAEQYRLKKLREAEGDATYKREVMQADGALAQKLDAYIKVNERYAEAIQGHAGPWVPNIQFSGSGSSGAQGGSAALDLISLLTAQTAKELSLDPSVGRSSPSR